jgi:Exostosin family
MHLKFWLCVLSSLSAVLAGEWDGNAEHRPDWQPSLPLKLPESVPFFIYEGPLFDWHKNCSEKGAELLQHHRNYKHGDDVLFLEHAMSHPWRVQNASEAVLFVVPVMLTFGVRHGACGLPHKEMQNITAAALAQSPWFNASGGRDHIIVASSFQTRLKKHFTDSFIGVMQNMIVGNFETYPRASFKSEQWQTSLWRCTVVTPYIDRHWHPVSHVETLEQFKSRPFSVFFLGQVDDRPAYSARRQLGTMLQAVPNITGIYASVSGLGASTYKTVCADICDAKGSCMLCTMGRDGGKYMEYLAGSRYALMLLGDTSTSSRLYDSISSGTLPIMVSTSNTLCLLPHSTVQQCRNI